MPTINWIWSPFSFFRENAKQLRYDESFLVQYDSKCDRRCSERIFKQSLDEISEKARFVDCYDREGVTNSLRKCRQ